MACYSRHSNPSKCQSCKAIPGKKKKRVIWNEVIIQSECTAQVDNSIRYAWTPARPCKHVASDLTKPSGEDTFINSQHCSASELTELGAFGWITASGVVLKWKKKCRSSMPIQIQMLPNNKLCRSGLESWVIRRCSKYLRLLLPKRSFPLMA